MKTQKPSNLGKKIGVPAGGGQTLRQIALPQPKFPRASLLFPALKNRQTTRKISGKKLSIQLLSNLLWAACGVNRSTGPFGSQGRTAASASNSQEIDVYVAMAERTYLYEASAHALIPVVGEDLRPLAIGPSQGMAGADAPVRLIYVVNLEKFKTAGYQEPGLYNPEVQKSYYFVDTGLMAENVYLAASSLGLAAWFHNCNKTELARKLNLAPERRPLFGQTIGYARKPR